MLHLDPDRTILLRRGLRRGALNLWRDRAWGAGLGALVGMFVLIQTLGVGLIVTEGIRDLLRSRTDLRLEVRPGATDQGIQEFYNAVQSHPVVEDVAFITKEQAYERARTEDPKLIAFLEEFGLANPFADTVGVTLRNLDTYGEFLMFVQQERWQAIVDPAFLSEATDQEQHVMELLTVTSAGRSIAVLVLLVTTAALLFSIIELTRSRALMRSEEVLVERLAGAHTLSILVPFATEALLLLLLAIAGSAVLMILALLIVPVLVPALGTDGVFEPLGNTLIPLLQTRLPLFLLIQVLLAPAISIGGAWLGIRPQVRSPRIALVAH